MSDDLHTPKTYKFRPRVGGFVSHDKRFVSHAVAKRIAPLVRRKFKPVILFEDTLWLQRMFAKAQRLLVRLSECEAERKEYGLHPLDVDWALDRVKDWIPLGEPCAAQTMGVHVNYVLAREVERLRAVAVALDIHNDSVVLSITDAYESGFGHASDELNNPYTEGTPEHKAWALGREEGVSRRTPPVTPI